MRANLKYMLTCFIFHCHHTIYASRTVGILPSKKIIARYMSFNGSGPLRYHKCEHLVEWRDALIQCKHMGAELARVVTEEDAKDINAFLHNNEEYVSEFWVGGSYVDLPQCNSFPLQDRCWKWTSGASGVPETQINFTVIAFAPFSGAAHLASRTIITLRYGNDALLSYSDNTSKLKCICDFEPSNTLPTSMTSVTTATPVKTTSSMTTITPMGMTTSSGTTIPMGMTTSSGTTAQMGMTTSIGMTTLMGVTPQMTTSTSIGITTPVATVTQMSTAVPMATTTKMTTLPGTPTFPAASTDTMPVTTVSPVNEITSTKSEARVSTSGYKPCKKFPYWIVIPRKDSIFKKWKILCDENFFTQLKIYVANKIRLR